MADVLMPARIAREAQPSEAMADRSTSAGVLADDLGAGMTHFVNKRRQSSTFILLHCASPCPTIVYMGSVGDRIRDAAARKGMMISAVAEKAGLSRQHLNKILSGKTGKSKHLPAIAHALEEDVEWLASGHRPLILDPSQVPPPLTAEQIAAQPAEVQTLISEVRALLAELRAQRASHGGPEKTPPADVLETYDQQFADAAAPRRPPAPPRDGRTENPADASSSPQPAPIRV